MVRTPRCLALSFTVRDFDPYFTRSVPVGLATAPSVPTRTRRRTFDRVVPFLSTVTAVVGVSLGTTAVCGVVALARGKPGAEAVTRAASRDPASAAWTLY